MIPGSNDSASVEDFDFSVEVTKFEPRELNIKFEFANPLAISIGKVPDIIRATVIKPDLFSSKDSGKTVKNGTSLEIAMPRQYLS